MPKPRVLQARWLLPIVFVVAAVALWRNAHPPNWRTLRPGLEFTTIQGEPWCRRGSSAIAVVRADPARVRVRVHHYAQLPAAAPPGIAEWQRRLGVAAVFNAGQYYPNYGYMGLLVADGHAITSGLHPTYRAALVAEPDSVVRSTRSARVLDLDEVKLDARRPGWKQIAQSYMLFDRKSGARVRRTDRIANRTVVAEDREGRLLVLVSEGGYTLGDFATVLMESPLHLTHAMSMDGGLEAELMVHVGDFRYATFGHWDSTIAAPAAPGATVPLPAVISLEPR